MNRLAVIILFLVILYCLICLILDFSGIVESEFIRG